MQGFILSIRKVKNRDLILRILTPSKILDLYRFYGVRHSILALGKKIDFDTERNALFLPKLRNILELGHSWEKEYSRVYVWQFFIALLSAHLKEIEEIEPFYFELLEKGAKKNKRQNPMRVALEMSADLIGYEGRNARAHHNRCFVCDEELGDEVSLGQAFLFAHPFCISGDCFNKEKILEFLDSGLSVHLSDDEIELLWKILSLGL